jgi:NAD+ diphosphatase
MKVGWPEAYPSAVELPFNRASYARQFQLAAPGLDPGGEGVWLLLQGNQLLTVLQKGRSTLPAGTAPGVGQHPPLYLGQWQGRPCRLLSVPHDQQIEGLTPHSLLAAEPQLPLSLLSLAGVGQMILHWEQTSRHCGNCGELLERLPKEWGKRCRICSNSHYPRLHPCVIGLVVRGAEILLVRKGEWPAGRFGLVAGFVEFGECLEEAMAREIAEETGLQVTNPRYVGSQCWPFPSQLMCGYVTDYAAGELRLQTDELEEACWCRLDRLPTLPPRRSIARYLIDRAGRYISAGQP